MDKIIDNVKTIARRRFYSSDEWKEVEREHLNSDRRYYEKRNAYQLNIT